MLIRGALAGAAVMLVWAVGAAGADAATFCVHSGTFSCPAGSTDEGSNLQAALDAAAGAAGRDTVVIGPGSFDAGANPPFSYTSADPVDVVGAGGPGNIQNATVLQDSTASSSSESALTLTGNASSTVSDLQVVIPTGSSTGGLDTDAQADRIVASPANASGSFETGVKLETGARLRHSHINSGPGIFGVTIQGTNTLIEDSDLLSNTSAFGSTTPNIAVTIRRSRLDSQIPAQLNSGGTLVAEDVLATVRRDTPGLGPLGFILQASSGSPINARFEHLTTIAFGQNAAAFQLSSNPTAPATLTVGNSIVSGWRNLISRSGSGQPADASFSYSDVPPAASESGPGSITQSSTVNVDPHFLNSVTDDYRLASDSPLVDAGDPAGLSSGESATDLGGEPRIVDASGSCTPRTDMGAFERQAGPRAPRAAAGATPAAALTGQAVTFDASASCDPDGDALVYLWRFDDGATAAGPVAQHAFAGAGTHTGTVTVTDATGRATTAAATVPVTRPHVFAGVALAAKTAKVSSKGVASVRLRCPAGSTTRCTGTLTLRAKKKKLGGANFRIAAGKTATVKVKLSKATRRSLRKRRRLAASAAVSARDGSGQRKRRTGKVTLLAPKR